MKIFGIFGKKDVSNYYNSTEFYKRRPDLVPRNIYLLEGRVITKKEVDKYMAKITCKTLSERVGEFIKKIKNCLGSTNIKEK